MDKFSLTCFLKVEVRRGKANSEDARVTLQVERPEKTRVTKGRWQLKRPS